MSALGHLVLWTLGFSSTSSATTLNERNALYEHVKGKRRVVEIGVWQGLNTGEFRKLMASDGILYAVDPFPPGRLGFSSIKVIARSNVNKSKHGKVVWLECLGSEAAALCKARDEGPLDFIFIDGDHSYEGIKGDWDAWTPLMATGGIVALHDSAVSENTSATHETGSVVFTENIIKKDARFRLLRQIDSLTILKRV